MSCLIHYTSSFGNIKPQNKVLSQRVLPSALYSRLATVSVKGNMMILKMGFVTGLMNDQNDYLALFHCCLYLPSLELLRPGKRLVRATRGAEAATKCSLKLQLSGFCTFSFSSLWFSFFFCDFLPLPPPSSSNTKLCVWVAGLGGHHSGSIFHPDLKSWMVVGSDFTAMYLF